MLGNTGEEPRVDRRRQREARRSLLGFLRRLRVACETFETADDWVEFVTGLNDILNLYQLEIPESSRQNLEAAMQLTDASREGIAQACQGLQLEIEKAIELLPKGGGCCGCLPAALIAGFAALVVILGVLGAGYIMFTNPVEVRVANQGCGTLLVREGLPPVLVPVVGLLGVKLPNEIPPGAEELIEVPSVPVTFQISPSSDRSLILSVLGYSQTIDLSGNVSGVTVNGINLLDGTYNVNVRDREQHSVVISCN